MNEDRWIEKLQQRFGAAAYDGRISLASSDGALSSGAVLLGDDAAVFPIEAGRAAVLTVDTLVAGTHFHHEWLDDTALAQRLVRVTVSDLSAMGARPEGLLLSIETPSLPGRVGDAFFDGIAAALEELAGDAQSDSIPLLGGNVTRSDHLSLHCFALGSVEIGRGITRSRAQPGDKLWVTGAPGAAGLVREQLLQGTLPSSSVGDPWRRPRFRNGFALNLQRLTTPHAAIDISDGLGLDLSRMLGSSGVGAVIDLGSLCVPSPTIPDLNPTLTPTLTPQQVLDGGEDYELLFAVSADAIAETTPSLFDTRIHCIGHCTADKLISFRINGQQINYTPKGWDPFVA